MFITHGQKNTRIYRIWGCMKARCYRPSHPWYHRYGARGIAVCSEWKDSFVNFFNWAMSHGYTDKLSIDRVNNDGNYCPENCRFVTQREQIRNRSNSRKTTIYGETKSLKEWADEYGLEYQTVYRRWEHGKRGESLIVPPMRNTALGEAERQ